MKKLFVGIGATIGLGTSSSGQEIASTIPGKDKQEKVSIALNNQYQFNPEHDVLYPTSSLENALPDEQEIITTYNENKDAFNTGFSEEFVIEKATHPESPFRSDQGVLISCSYPENIKIKILNYDDQRQVISREKFTLETLAEKYPEYVSYVKSQYEKAYHQYILEQGWKVKNKQLEGKLANDFTNYQPSNEELELITQLIEKRIQGNPVDGYDDLYSYYKKTGSELYEFYKKYNGTPEALSLHMKEKYFDPAVAAIK